MKGFGIIPSTIDRDQLDAALDGVRKARRHIHQKLLENEGALVVACRLLEQHDPEWGRDLREVLDAIRTYSERSNDFRRIIIEAGRDAAKEAGR